MDGIRSLEEATEDKTKEDLNNLLKIETAKLKYDNDDEKASRICAKKVIEADAETGKQQVREVYHIDVLEMITERDAKDSPMSPGKLIEFDQDQEKSCYKSASYPPKK